jgi:hypothetical protein
MVKPQDGGRDVLENLITLCPGCHAKQHKAMAGKGRQVFPIDRGVRGVKQTPTPGSPVAIPSPIFSPSVSPPSPNGSHSEDGNYEDDPEAGIFWGPKQPNGMMTRWSRPWFDWRNGLEHE